jgi:carbamoyl-phosphate synthase large subunit
MPSRKTIHILGGGQWQVPTIELAKSLGFRVLVTDMYPERPGYALADEYAVMDITDREGTLRIASERRIDGIVCDTTDVGVPTMAYVAEKLGLAGIGYEIALNFTNKRRMRELTAAAGLPNPPFRAASTLEEARAAALEIGFPCVVKPVDNQSSRGVHIVRAPRELEGAFEDASNFSRSGEALVEGFLDGVEVTVESFCLDGQVYAAGISDKDHFAHRPEVACRLTYPADFSPETLARIRRVNEDVVRALGMRTGITHGEYMVCEGEPYLVEIAARGAGSRVYSHIAPYLAGAPIPKLYLDFVMGARPTFEPHEGERAANLAFFCAGAGIVRTIEGVEEAKRLPGVQEILLEFAVGDRLSLPADDRSRPGLVVVFGATRDEVLDVTAEVFRTVRITVE